MPPFAVEVHPLAADEGEAAERWYRERNETAATRFRRELDRVVDVIAERPETGSPYLSSTRRVLLRRFPFFIVACSTHEFRSSPWRTRADVQDTGASGKSKEPVVQGRNTETDRRRSFAIAHRRALVRLRKGLDLRWTPATTRDDPHERVRPPDGRVRLPSRPGRHFRPGRSP